jgi:predicted NBD/HSP70 family sugar kinase
VNRAAILRLVGSSGPIARTTIAARLGLSSATVTIVTRELIEQGVLRVAERAPSRGGRPKLLLELVGQAATAFGVKIALDHLVGVRVDLAAEPLERFETDFDATSDHALEELGDILDRWLTSTATAAPLLGVGLGVPGVFDRETGKLDSPLLGWRGDRLEHVLRKRLRLPVLVDNDVNTLAVWERLYGRGREFEHFVTVTIGRGVGLGVVVSGDIYRGLRGGAGEFGHVTVVDGGPRCTCGKTGCLEAVVGDPALVAQARRAGILSSRQGIDALRRLAEQGEQGAVEIYAGAGAVLGRAVSGLVNVLAPELVLISGEGTQAWSLLEPSFERELRAHIFTSLAGVPVEVDPWDDAKWAVGAASLVLRATLTASIDGENDESIRARIGAGVPVPEVVA